MRIAVIRFIRPILYILFAGFLGVPLGCGGGGGGGGTPQPQTCVEFTAAAVPASGLVTARSGGASTCQSLVLEVMVTDLTDVFAAEFEITYPTTLMSYQGSSTTGSFLASGGTTVEVIESVNGGTVSLGLTRLGVTDGIDVTAPAVLVRLTFTKTTANSGSGTIAFPTGELFGSETPPVEKPGLTWQGGSAVIR